MAELGAAKAPLVVQVVLRFASSSARKATEIRSSSQSLGSALEGVLHLQVVHYYAIPVSIAGLLCARCQSVRHEVGLDSTLAAGAALASCAHSRSFPWQTMPAFHVKMHIRRMPEGSAKFGIFFRMSPGCLGCKNRRPNPRQTFRSRVATEAAWAPTPDASAPSPSRKSSP